MSFDITRILRFFVMSMGFAYPIRFVAGFSLAILIWYLLAALAIDHDSVTILRLILKWPELFVFALGSIISFGSTLFRPLIGSDDLTSGLDAVEEIMQRAQFSEYKKKLIWNKIADKFVDSIDTKDRIDKKRLVELSKLAIEEDSKHDPGDPPLAI